VRAGYLVTRIVLVWLLTAGALLLLSAILPGFHVTNWAAALATAAFIGLANALVWPFIVRIALPFTVLTLGLGALFLNGLVVLAAAALDPGVTIDGVFDGVLVALGLTAVNTFFTALFAIDDEDFWYSHAVRRQARRAGLLTSDVPGVYFLEIDGLAHAVLRRAIRDGNAPNLARWAHDGGHRLLRWETDWSSQTGACQAGLLHGDNHDMPAFRWWEKEHGKAIVTNHPHDAAELERRHSNGRGLLHEDGASRANIVSGDAVHSLLTMSTVLDRSRHGRIGQDYFGYFANPYSATRTLLLALVDIAQELRFAAQQRRRDVRPRVHRDFKYALVRAWGTVVQRDLQVAAVIADLYAGRPVGYTTFLAYDEVAHHSGVERADALAVLRQVDRQIGRIAAAAKDAPRPYEFVVLSDHGQSQGATFLQRYGISLEELVSKACAAEEVDAQKARSNEALGMLAASLTEASAGEGASARVLDRAVRRRRVDGEVRLGEQDGPARLPDRTSAAAPAADGLPELSVMASGNLGLISFPREPGRVTLETIEARWPRLVPALREHPGFGFLLVRSERRGSLVLGPRGERRLDDYSVEGEDPLAPFGPNAARHVKRTDGFPHCPDIVVNSTFWEELDEVAAFEELVGSHGGMGGEQSHPFVLIPAGWTQPQGEIVGAEALHRHFRGWLAGLGHDAFK
jgi:uncharacterized membrane protein YvlD (DUF360 family)